MRRLDAKMRVLAAIYAEYQKDVPNMWNVNCTSLRMEWNAFRAAIMKLQNEELIRGLATKTPAEVRIGSVEEIDMSDVMPTVDGLKAVERFIETGTTDTANERLERLGNAAKGACENEIIQFIENVRKEVEHDDNIRNMRGYDR